MNILKHTCCGKAERWEKPDTCLRCDLTELLKTVATSKRGVMNLGDGSELSRIEAALAEAAPNQE